MPEFIKDEFDAFFECGILDHGFLRLRYDDCAHEKLVASTTTLARRLADGIAGSRFLEIPDCGHCSQLEKPEIFVNAVEKFLR